MSSVDQVLVETCKTHHCSPINVENDPKLKCRETNVLSYINLYIWQDAYDPLQTKGTMQIS